MNVEIATVCDLESLDEIQKECLEKLEHQDFDFVLKNQNFVVVKGEIENRIVGFVSASFSFEQCDILQVCVCGKFRRQGLGKELLIAFENIMKEKGVCELFLEVNEKNIPAINLYNSMNFSFLSKRKKYYGENDAIVMHKTL